MVKTYPCFYSTDVQSPTFLNCPSKRTVYAQRGKTTATVSWALVKATDNDMFPIIPQPRPNVKSTYEFAEGSHTVIYTAMDQSRNKAFCYFRVNVRGKKCCNIISRKLCNNAIYRWKWKYFPVETRSKPQFCRHKLFSLDPRKAKKSRVKKLKTNKQSEQKILCFLTQISPSLFSRHLYFLFFCT